MVQHRVPGILAFLTQHLTRYPVYVTLNNQTIIILVMCDIWSLFYSGTSTHISDPNEFYRSTSSSMDYQWCKTLAGR